ncbi:hypothetical protein ACFSKI_04560 [Pseudogracilibacillus auburnensis]|uniref:Type VII secretion effector (TIGR04197 family) n=1 Tax=Pseudogracilibacillus auburnensis TaxID=1494959 RepID=A0A2V3VZ63_9BACI|nr:hypothetical protein [Pseudogracilibacillus auburnensis]MBO1002419.1 hypothetical protein [Pseudogracilibacillus auburnensis]PXW86191.1 type VII secretion effector (TIGR04197 family) [Pseudogracilibacillus auburnensis]
MGEKISLNIDMFQDNMNELRNAVNHLGNYMDKAETLEKTNIPLFLNDLENMITALEFLDEYKLLFQEDLVVVNDIAEKIREQDERLSKVQKDDLRDGYQPI